MKVVVNVLIKQNNKILMVKEAAGNERNKWNFPAGHLDENENIFDGAVREAREETGYNVKLTGIIDIQNLVTDNKHVLLIMFAGEIIDGEVSFDESEILDVKFINISEIYKMTDAELRSAELRKRSVQLLEDGKIYPLEIIRNYDYRK